jgi:AmmeMemoRadiSam system protein B
VHNKIRPSLIAGQWYPGQPGALRRTIERYLDQVVPPAYQGQIVALISPHAGYTYSGQTAAYAYAQVRGASFETVVVVSPVHRVPLGRFAVTEADAYETPLGLVPLDTDLVSALLEEVPLERVGYDGEHSLEIQLPFLQVALGSFQLLPVMVGASNFAAARELGEALARITRGRRSLLVASTDMHHIPDYAQVVRRDQRVIDAVATYDLDRIRAELSAPDCSVCGRIPMYAVLSAAQKLGADHVEILHHTNSGAVTGQTAPGQYTVGYLAAAAYRSP